MISHTSTLPRQSSVDGEYLDDLTHIFVRNSLPFQYVCCVFKKILDQAAELHCR
jgi:hypothetical protein